MTLDFDPVTIREALSVHRKNGTPWPEAWADAAGPKPPNATGLWPFMETHFRAAYLDTPSSLGRHTMAERDTHEGERVPVAVSSTRAGRCRSGDGCQRVATRGRFGPKFCEHHFAELSYLTAKLNGGRAAKAYHIFGTVGAING